MTNRQRLRDGGARVADLPPTDRLPFPRAWIPRAATGHLPIELLTTGTAARLVRASRACHVRDVR